MPTLNIEGIFVWLSFRTYILLLVSAKLLKFLLSKSYEMYTQGQ